jgi:hypothetical protein
MYINIFYCKGKVHIGIFFITPGGLLQQRSSLFTKAGIIKNVLPVALQVFIFKYAHVTKII